MTFCDSCVVRNRAICSALEGTELDALNAIGRRRTLKAGESISFRYYRGQQDATGTLQF